MSQKIVLQTTNFETNDIIEDVNVDAVKQNKVHKMYLKLIGSNFLFTEFLRYKIQNIRDKV